jgi:glycogen phosphorylase
LNVARYLVEGCDIWLNTPRRPLEASGTSGMKVIANGGLNFSVLDGWWDEGFDPEIGWKIGNGEEYTDPDYQDDIESHQFYDTLERHIIPLYYTRNEDKLPRQWISMVKNSMKKLGPKFNTHRMVEEYFANYYLPSFQKRILLKGKKWEKAKELSLWENNLNSNWSNINVVNVEADGQSKQYKVGENFPVKAEIRLGNLTPNDVEVQIYYGPYEKQDNPQFNSNVVMNVENKKSNDGIYKFVGYVKCRESGQIGYTIRILPKNSLLIHPFELGLVYWA